MGKVALETVANQEVSTGKTKSYKTNKYDGRRKNGAHRRAPCDRGAKPRWLKHLGRNDALKVSEKYDAIATYEQLYRDAYEKKNLLLCFDMRKYADDRLLGKPFIALNPAENAKSANLTQDNRLQVAIQQLTIGNTPKEPAKRVYKSAKTIVAERRKLLEAAQPNDNQALS